MRIHWNKVYRAFPELDRFDDGQCREFIRLAGSRFKLARAVCTAAGATFCVALLVAMLIGENYLLMRRLYPSIVLQLRSSWFASVHALAVGVSVFLPLLCGLHIRDRWVRWAVSTQIVSTSCLNCRYSLLGLVPDDGEVLCPECGHSTNLASRGLSAKELFAEEPPPMASRR